VYVVLSLMRTSMWALSNADAIQRRAIRMAEKRQEAEEEERRREAELEATFGGRGREPSEAEQRASGEWVAGRRGGAGGKSVYGLAEGTEVPSVGEASDSHTVRGSSEKGPEKPFNPYAIEGEGEGEG